MIYKFSNGEMVVEFTGHNWMECGKFLGLYEMARFDASSDNIDILESTIQNSIRPYHLVPGNCLLRKWPSKRAITYSNRAETNHASEMRSIPCIIEDADEVLRAMQYVTTSDLTAIMDFLETWRCKELRHDQNGYPEFMIYDPRDVNSGHTLHRGDWIVVNLNKSPTTVRIMQDTQFQCKYDQIGHIVTTRPSTFDAIGIAKAMASDRRLDIALISMMHLNTIAEIQGGFAPNTMYDMTINTLKQIGQAARIVIPREKYVAIQYASEDSIKAVKALYPMMQFVEDVYYKDHPTLAIMIHDLPAGVIKWSEWFIFSHSTPDNPKFTIVSDEEYRQKYRISE